VFFVYEETNSLHKGTFNLQDKRSKIRCDANIDYSLEQL
jgi:hypothetical protein